MLALTAATLITVAGCGPLRAQPSSRLDTSKPTFAAIVLRASAMVNEQGAVITFPAGEYRFSEADRRGYYFQAPRKIIVDDVAVYGYEGGLYVRSGSNEPTHWYLVRNGRAQIGRFKQVPAHKLIQ